MNKREIVQATVRDFSRLSYEAQQFVLGYMVARANCTANATTPADQPEQKKPVGQNSLRKKEKQQNRKVREKSKKLPKSSVKLRTTNLKQPTITVCKS